MTATQNNHSTSNNPNSNKVRRWKVEVQSLTPGAPLTYDLFDDLGRLLVPAGQPVSKSVIEYMLSRGLRWLLIDSNLEVSNPPVAVQTKPYDRQSVELIKKSFRDCEQSLSLSCTSLLSGASVEIESLEQVLDVFFKESQRDVAPLLATALAHSTDAKDIRLQLLERSVRLSAIVTAMGNVMDQSQADIRALGMAALLGDLALLLPDSLKDIQLARGRMAAARNFAKHPIQSSELTLKVKCFPPLSRLLITQIHEELDGQGFPLGLSLVRVHPLARILNVADAYLTMVNPLGSELGVLPADAIACLVFHAGEGKLCPRAVNALVECVSMYPVASRILLENKMKAKVVRACPTDPMKPAVIFEDDSHESGDIIDLRCCPVRIQMPIPGESLSQIGRLRLSKLNSPVWHQSSHDYVLLQSSHD